MLIIVPEHFISELYNTSYFAVIGKVLDTHLT